MTFQNKMSLTLFMFQHSWSDKAHSVNTLKERNLRMALTVIRNGGIGELEPHAE